MLNTEKTRKLRHISRILEEDEFRTPLSTKTRFVAVDRAFVAPYSLYLRGNPAAAEQWRQIVAAVVSVATENPRNPEYTC